ncbi:hypothetical protein [Paenibacillus sp. A3]|uniref:hypothetical protein n=1 Tax=Paenibacillus sp. A3 TaxID=1337054 RepID=UPI0006D54FBF|nr:hypothetical protein [Paenibacillus sp. A3]
MKEAIIIDFNGFMIDVTLVADDATGVFPFYRTQEPLAQEDMGQQSNTKMMGYVVAIPVPEGLFKPRFDIEAWNEYNPSQRPLSDEHTGSRPDVTLWIEGLKPEEILVIPNQHNQKTSDRTVSVLTANLSKKQPMFSVWDRLWKK